MELVKNQSKLIPALKSKKDRINGRVGVKESCLVFKNRLKFLNEKKNLHR
jgi:hypothetical protein